LPLKSCVVDFEDETGIDSLDFSATGKNLLRINKDRVAFDNGIVFTTNNDKSETISGEFRGTAVCRVSILVSLNAGTYILTGCPSDGGYSDYVLRLENSSNALIALDIGIGATFTLTENQPVYCRIYIYSQNGVGKTFFPMVRLVDSDPAYEPFGFNKLFSFGKTIQDGSLNVLTGELTNNDTTPPEVINIGGMNIETLQGENNLFASTGETTASYIKIGG
jgi:hypothetical protein